METVAVILHDKADRLLLGERQHTGRRDGDWSLPGVSLRERELPEHALARCVREELNIEHAEPSFAFSVREALDTTLHVFVLDTWSGSIRNLNTRFCAGFDWFDVAALPAMTPSSRLVIDSYVQRTT